MKKINNSGEKYKARLVAKGVHCKDGTISFDICTLLARIISFRLSLALAFIYKLQIH